jgi:hypothetical protein
MQNTTVVHQTWRKIGEHIPADMCYAQFRLIENNASIMIFEGKRHIATVATMKQAQELINTINSGC